MQFRKSWKSEFTSTLWQINSPRKPSERSLQWVSPQVDYEEILLNNCVYMW